MCNRVLPLLEKLPQENLHVNCHVNGTKFQGGLTFQTGMSSLQVSCKRTLTVSSISRLGDLMLGYFCLFFVLLVHKYSFNIKTYKIGHVKQN